MALQLWNGGGTNTHAAFYPYVYTGSYTDLDTLTEVKGSVNPVVNDSVCYSGAFSGRVCSNKVTSVNQLICYSVTMCYAGQTRTTQTAGTPAAGNGDSGGPVYASIGGNLHAAGIISGISNGTASCTGYPGSTAANGRKCSADAIFAPLAVGLGSTGWGLAIVS